MIPDTTKEIKPEKSSGFLSRIKPYLHDFFVLICLVLVGFIGYNLGRTNALQKTPIQLGQANIFGQTSGQETKSVTSRTGSTTKTSAPKATPKPQAPRDPRVVVSKSSTSKKYHYSWCTSGSKIKEENKIWFDTEQAAQASGYTLAGNCQ
jgi:hypothetical protein